MEETSWNEGLVMSMFTEEAANRILNISWPSFVCNVKLLWEGNKTWMFLVKICFDLNYYISERAAPGCGRSFKSSIFMLDLKCSRGEFLQE